MTDYEYAKPCPFCGAKVQNTDGLIRHEQACYIMVHFYGTPTRERDLVAWNKRAYEQDIEDKKAGRYIIDRFGCFLVYNPLPAEEPADDPAD